MADRHPRAGSRQRRAIGVPCFLILPGQGFAAGLDGFQGDGLGSLCGARLHGRGGRVPGEGDLVLAQIGDHLARAGGACYIGSGAGAPPAHSR